MQSSKDAPNAMASWNAKKAETAELMTLLESYKAAGDAKHEVRTRHGAGACTGACWRGEGARCVHRHQNRLRHRQDRPTTSSAPRTDGSARRGAARRQGQPL
jgi:hypothetical protein